MKKLLVIGTVVCTALGTSSAMAFQATDTVSSKMKVQEIHESTLLDARAARDLIKAVRGVYDMDDGTTLSLYRNGIAIVAEVNGRAPVEVVATRARTFVAKDGATRINFIQDAGGQVSSVKMTKRN